MRALGAGVVPVPEAERGWPRTQPAAWAPAAKTPASGGPSRGGRGEARDGDGAAVPELVAAAGDGGRATTSSGEAQAWLDAKARGGGRGRRGGARSRREVRAEAVDVAAERERARGGDVVRGRRARVEQRVRA